MLEPSSVPIPPLHILKVLKQCRLIINCYHITNVHEMIQNNQRMEIQRQNSKETIVTQLLSLNNSESDEWLSLILT